MACVNRSGMQQGLVPQTNNVSCKSQPIQAFEHPSFKNMINIAARATNGVKIPDRRQTRQAIIDTFKRQLAALCDRLNVRKIPHYYHVLTFYLECEGKGKYNM